MTIAQLKQIIADAGIVGAGGAGFPTAVKVAEGADTLLINASECEPLLYTDYTLIRDRIETVAAGAEAVMAAAGIKQGFLGFKMYRAGLIGLKDGQQISEHVRVRLLPNVYPMGDEVILIYQMLHRIVPPGQLPLSVGVLVFNSETLYNIAMAVREQAPVTEKWITVSGEVRHPFVAHVPVGTPVAELMRRYDVTVPDDFVMIDGGPAMGRIINPATAVITKTTKGLLVLPANIPAIRNRMATDRTVMTHASANCCQCTLCTDLCPRALIGYPLHPHKIVRNSMAMIEENPELFTEATMCSGCGVCELTSCCQEISPRRVYTKVKAVLAKNKLKYQPQGELTPNPDREYRLLPSSRFKRMIGVSPYDHFVPEYTENTWTPDTVRLPLRQHIGAPAKATVNAGDHVSRGQVVAAADGVISANIHASVSGEVVAVSATEITIRTARS